MKDAESALAMALVLDGSLTMARYQLGLLQFTDSRVAVALLTWEPLLSLESTNPLPHLVRGFGTLAGDQLPEARPCFAAALDRAGSNPALQSDILKIMERIDQSVATLPAAPTTDSVHPPAGSTEKDEDNDLNHVLLSNYQSQGRPH